MKEGMRAQGVPKPQRNTPLSQRGIKLGTLSELHEAYDKEMGPKSKDS